MVSIDIFVQNDEMHSLFVNVLNGTSLHYSWMWQHLEKEVLESLSVYVLQVEHLELPMHMFKEGWLVIYP